MQTSTQSFFAVTSLILLTATHPAFAQPGNPGFAAPGTQDAASGVPAPNKSNTSDRFFVQIAAIGGMSEVELGKLAQQQGASDPIQALGKQIVQNHGKANDNLAKVAKAAGIPLPDAPDTQHKAIHERLEKLKGGDFNAAYIDAQLAAHQMTAQLLEYEIGSGQDAALKDFASEILPVVLQHLDRAQETNGQLRGATVQLVSAKLAVPNKHDATDKPAAGETKGRQK